MANRKIQEKDDTVNTLIKIKEYCKEHYITNNCNNCKFLGVHQDRCGFYDIDNEFILQMIGNLMIYRQIRFFISKEIIL